MIALKYDISSDLTDLQKNLFFKVHSWRRRFSILFSISSILVFLIIYFHIWNKIRKSVWQHIRKNVFWIAILYLWTRQPYSFHSVIFNQITFGRFGKGLFLKVCSHTIIYYCGLLINFFLILEDLFQSSNGMP